MKNHTIATLLLSLVSPLALAAPNKAEPDFAPGRIIVEPQAGLTADDFAKELKVHGAGKARKLGQSNIHVIDVPHGSEKAIANKLKHNPHFKFAEIDRRMELSATTNDPYLGSEWHISKIGATTAWDKAQGAGITIAILDSGIDASHPDLAGRIVPGYNVYDNNTNTAEVCGHGTKVAGAAAAASNNGVGVAGVAGQAKILPVRITDLECYAYFSTTANGIIYAADHGARVVNVSYGYTPLSTAAQSAANYLRSKGGLLFVSTGNNAIDENITPTNTMISVSSTDSSDNLSSFSSWGAFTVLSAPGSGIYTTIAGGGYGGVNGTSFSSPVAAATAALVMSANPSLSADQVQNILFSTAVDLGAAGRDSKFGYGRVNAAAAVAAAGGSTAPAPAPTDTTKPTVVIANPLAGSTVTGTVTVSANATDNIGVTRVELKVNGTTVASDSSGPFAFAWDTKGTANGTANLVAVAYDAAGNVASSSTVAVNVANATALPAPTTDTTPPVVAITNPVAGVVNGNVEVVANASDNSGAAGIKLSIYIDGSAVATGSGSSLSYRWNTRKISTGYHTVQAVARDAAGNTSTRSVQVSR